MRLLLDTPAFLWWVADDPRLSRRAARAIAASRNDVHLSVVSAWELVLKVDAGSLRLPGRPEHVIPEEMERHSFAPLSVELRHVIAASSLPTLHRDPFDRMLVAQAMVEDLVLVTGDERIAGYQVRVLW